MFLAKRAVNRAKLSELTGIGTDRLSQLSNNPKSHLRVKEMYLISLAIEVDSSELVKYICDGVKLPQSTLEE